MVWRNMALLVGICNYERNGMILEYNFVIDRHIIMKCIKHSKKPPENKPAYCRTQNFYSTLKAHLKLVISCTIPYNNWHNRPMTEMARQMPQNLK